MEALRIYFRQHQLTDINNGNQNVVVNCGSIATYVPGNVDSIWYEMTDFTEGLDKLQLSWDAVNQGNSSNSATNSAGSNYDKGISLNLTFYGDAFDYIFNWLLTNQCQILNAIDVRIDDVLCAKSFRLFEIKVDGLKYAPGDICRIEVTLREQDLIWHCVHKTFIWDDWQGWFNKDGTSTRQHPTFLTCIEPRPRLMNSVRIAFMFFYYGNPIIKIFSGNIKDDVRRILELENFVPAPLIRDYIDNVAGKCGLSVDTIFHRAATPEYNACLFHPLSGQMYENDADNEISPSTAFIFENRWDITLAELLDKLKMLYASEWYVTPNATIVFKPIAELIDLAPIYDFTDPLNTLPINGLTYTFSGTKKPAYGRYQYQPDGSDLGSQEISNLYNDLTDFDGPSNNPMLEGELNKSFEFAPTAFIRDGRTKDYIKLLIGDGRTAALVLTAALGVVALALGIGVLSLGAAAALGGFVIAWEIFIADAGDRMRNHFTDPQGSYTGSVRLVTANQTMTPRILSWDGVSINRAKVVRNADPVPSSYYNPTSVPYTTNNKIAQDNPSSSLYNYPMYFDSKYEYNMFDRFHDAIDNPLKSLESNQEFDFDTDLCCAAMDLLGLWDNDFVKIGYLLKIEKRTNYDVYGRIKHIELSYDDYTITIKGDVIRKRTTTAPPPPPPPVCVPVNITTLTLPNAVSGNAYNSSIVPTGTAPFTVSNITAPAWFIINPSGSFINHSGTPAVTDVGTGIVISYTVTNACGTDNFATTIDVAAAGVIAVPPGFIFDYGYTDLDTTGVAPNEAAFIASVATGTIITGTATNTGVNIQIDNFTNPTDKVLFIEVPNTEADFIYWSEAGSPQLQQDIDPTFASGNNVWFKSVNGSNTIYMTRFQTSFPMGAIILSR